MAGSCSPLQGVNTVFVKWVQSHRTNQSLRERVAVRVSVVLLLSSQAGNCTM